MLQARTAAARRQLGWRRRQSCYHPPTITGGREQRTQPRYLGVRSCNVSGDSAVDGYVECSQWCDCHCRRVGIRVYHPTCRVQRCGLHLPSDWVSRLGSVFTTAGVSTAAVEAASIMTGATAAASTVTGSANLNCVTAARVASPGGRESRACCAASSDTTDAQVGKKLLRCLVAGVAGGVALRTCVEGIAAAAATAAELAAAVRADA